MCVVIAVLTFAISASTVFIALKVCVVYIDHPLLVLISACLLRLRAPL